LLLVLLLRCHRGGGGGGGGRGFGSGGSGVGGVGGGVCKPSHQRRQVGHEHDENENRKAFRRLVTKDHLRSGKA